jgi:hypothetical protein
MGDASMMIALVTLVALFVVAIGLWAVISPPGRGWLATRCQSQTGFWTAILFHLLFGVALWFSAPHARHPVVFQVLAVVVVAPLLVLAIARSRIQASASWWSARSSAFVFVWALVELVAGACVLLALIVSSIQDASNLATIAGIVIGASWAIYTWRHQESLRNIKENPGLECSFSCSQIALPFERVLLTVDCSVRNTGVWPIFPVFERASFRIGRIPADAATGFLKPDGPVEEAEEWLCAPNRKGMRLEPQTNTVLPVHYLARPGYLYAVTFTLPSNILTEDGKPWDWTKSLFQKGGSRT